jgi:hypothetical protein
MIFRKKENEEEEVVEDKGLEELKVEFAELKGGAKEVTREELAELKEEVEEVTKEEEVEELTKKEYAEEGENGLPRLATLCIDSLINCAEIDTSLRAALLELLKKVQLTLCTLNHPTLRAVSTILSGNVKRVPEDVMKELREKGFVKPSYRVKINEEVEAATREELMKELEEHVIEEYEVTGVLRELLRSSPVKLEVSKAHEVLPLIQAGIAELYLIPSKWDVLTWENLKMEKDVERVKNNLEEMKSVVEHQPEELKAPFEKMIDDLLSAPQ